MANGAEHGARMFFVHIEIRGMRDSEYNRDRIDGALHTVGLSGFTQAADGRVLRLPGNLYVGQFESARAAHSANVLVFCSLAAGNAAYQTLKVLGGASAVGPILLGLSRPVAALQNNVSVEDIVNMTAYVVLKAQQAQRQQLRA